MRTLRETIVTVGRVPRSITARATPRRRPYAANVTYVPSEEVLLLGVDLPLASAQKRLAALPFAIEDRIAVPLETVHVALGDEITPRRYLVGVASHARMAEWLAELGEAGRPHAAMVPDVLALPLPASGEWAIDLRGSRALVRAGDGTGLALSVTALASAWMAAGRPAFLSLGEAAPRGARPPRPGGSVILLRPTLDLRQGRYASRLPRLSVPWRRAAVVVAIGLRAHLAILIADTLALREIADARRNETRGLVAAAAPGRWAGDDIMTVAMDLLPRDGTDRPSRFMPLLGRLSASLGPLAPGVALRALRFDAAAGTLALDVEAAEPALIDRAGSALGAAPTGTMVVEGGRAHATIALQDVPAS